MKAYLMSFVLIVSFFTSATTTTRRILHQPLFPETSTPPPGSEPPPSQPPPTASEHPFFHENPNGKTESPPPPPAAQGVATNSTATHPIAPQPANKPIKKIAVAISVGLVTLGMLSALAFFIYKHKSKQQSESRKLVGGNSFQGNNEETSINLPPSSFLYIGTVEPSITTTESTNGTRNGSPYNKLNSIKRSNRYRPSPELQPLPPLTKPQPPPPPAASSSDDEEEENQDFYTPNGSTASTDDGYSVRSFRHNHRRNPSPMPLSKRTSPKSRLSISSSPDTISDRFHPSDSPSPKIRTVDSMIVSYGKGRLTCFPGDPESIYDVVPADMVVNAMIATIMAKTNQTSTGTIYHVGSSTSNPLKFPLLQKCIYQYFTEHPYADKEGKSVIVGECKGLESMASFHRYITLRYLLPLQVLKVVNVMLFHAFEGTYKNIERKVNSVIRLAKLYKPYLFSRSIYDDINTEKLRNIVKESCHEENVFYFDPSVVDWEDYFMHIHIPGLVRYEFK